MTLYVFIFSQYSGVKTFSSCSLSDFENFVSKMGARCLQNKPQMQASAQSTCGNRRVEGSEVCDCGTVEVGLITRKLINIFIVLVHPFIINVIYLNYD